MKALAQENVRKFGKRLRSLGIVCKELTGDMQLTKTEISETHIIVTTPEKWDIITRKSDDVVRIVKLLILDEVHLLQDDRGSVIEAIVARTTRLVESAQTMIRIVGLSATLPNYIDVAAFLKAENGVLYFDDKYRPVPLSKTFIGVADANSMKVRNMMNEVCFIKVQEAVREGHQVMVFVHSRKETLKTAQFLREAFQENDQCSLVYPDEVVHSQQLAKIKKRSGIQTELFHLLIHGFGTHHAGMRRENRRVVEEAFLEGTVKVLCCTATLAWGVNLPAHTVIIKGTTIYDTKRGGFVDVSILDVMQIFGRAGRPQFDKVGGGEAFIITHKNRLRHFISSMTNSTPIESTFHSDLANHLNAEIVLGTVTNMTEAIQWLQYTYLYVRLIRCPSKYIDTTSNFYTAYKNDPFFSSKLREMLEGAAMELAKVKMARFDSGDNFYATDVGRIASFFYIDCATVGNWNKNICNNCTVEDILDLICSATEFEQLQMRDEEERDLIKLRKECCPYEIKSLYSEPDGSRTKANILLQCYIGRQLWQIKNSTLINDLLYIKTNSGRIARALFEV